MCNAAQQSNHASACEEYDDGIKYVWLFLWVTCVPIGMRRLSRLPATEVEGPLVNVVAVEVAVAAGLADVADVVLDTTAGADVSGLDGDGASGAVLPVPDLGSLPPTAELAADTVVVRDGDTGEVQVAMLADRARGAADVDTTVVTEEAAKNEVTDTAEDGGDDLGEATEDAEEEEASALLEVLLFVALLVVARGAVVADAVVTEADGLGLVLLTEAGVGLDGSTLSGNEGHDLAVAREEGDTGVLLLTDEGVEVAIVEAELVAVAQAVEGELASGVGGAVLAGVEAVERGANLKGRDGGGDKSEKGEELHFDC